MPATHIPRYPVVDPEPSMTKAMGNFNWNDVAHIGAFATAGYVVGWFGARRPFRGINSKFLGGVGLFGGFLYAVMRSTQRFAGLEPNANEVARFGALSTEQLATRINHINVPNKSLVESE